MKTDVRMPRIGTNDNFVTLTGWEVQEGEYVSKGQVIAQIETTKISSELEAVSEGYIHFLIENGETAAVGAVICQIGDVYEANDKENTANIKNEDKTISAKARKLIQEHKLDPDVFKDLSIVRQKDVLSYLEAIKEAERPKATNINKQILISGGGGMCKMLIDALAQRGEYKIAGILDRGYPDSSPVRGISVISKNDEESLKRLYEKGYRIMINAIMFDKNKHDRKSPFLLMKKTGFETLNVIHNKAIVEPGVSMGEGNFIGAGAMVGSDVCIGDNCAINTGAIVSHDCIIGSHTHIASGSVLGGSVIVGENTLIGQGCTIFKEITIGKNVVISNGAHIFENIPDNTVIMP